MSIEYKYEIVSVDETARCMEVVYTAEGHQTLNIGARLPYAGESLEAVVQMFSPVRFWEEQQLVVEVPLVGTQGRVTSASLAAQAVPEVAESAQAGDTIYTVGTGSVVVSRV